MSDQTPPKRPQWNATEAALIQGVRDAEALAAVTQERDRYHAMFDGVNRALGAVTGERDLARADLERYREFVRAYDAVRDGSWGGTPAMDALDAARAAIGDPP